MTTPPKHPKYATTVEAKGPKHPKLTFDNYTIRDGLSEEPPKEPMFQISRGVVAAAGICALTFALGVVVTLQFMRPAAAPVSVAAASETFSAPPPAVASPPAEAAVTRNVPVDLISTVPPAATPVSAPAPAPATAALQQAVLAGLQPERTVGKLTLDEMARKSVEAEQIVNRNKLRMLREGVLAGIYSIEAKDVNGQKRLALRTVNAPLTQERTASLLAASAKRGEIELPSSLNTAEGVIDEDTLLFTLVQNSLANDGTPEGAEAAREMGRRAFAASNAQTRQVQGERTYLVQSGDSLAYISLQFYGRPNDYMRIFEANRETLVSPDLIKIGQRLIIPS